MTRISVVGAFLSVLPMLFLTHTVGASSFSGGTSSFVTKASRRPNIIFIMIDDSGRELIPQLNSKYSHSPGQITFTGSTLATPNNSYPLRTASDFPNISTLLANGINFTGMWSGSWCSATRYMLSTGNPGTGGDGFATTNPGQGRKTPMRHITETTNSAYKIAHYGKNMMGCTPSVNQSGHVLLACSPDGDGNSASLSVDNTNDAPPGNTQLGGIEWDAGVWTQTSATKVMPVAEDAQLWHLDVGGVSTQYMYVDEAGLIMAKRHVQPDQSASGLPFSDLTWFANQTGQPFVITYSPGSTMHNSKRSCIQNRTIDNDYVVPTLNAQLGGTGSSGTGADPPLGPTPNFGPATSPTYDEVKNDGLAFNAGGIGYYKIVYDCTMTKLEWIDDEIGKIIDWLGPHGLENTLIVLTGDNGTSGELIANRTGAWIPAHTTAWPTPSPPELFDLSLAGGHPAVPPPNSVLSDGKSNYTETGLNVAFVVAYGSVPQRLRGTSSATRLNMADVAETTVQLVSPNSVGTGYYPEGRDFTPLIYGTATDQDNLFGHSAVTLAADGIENLGQMAASMNPDADGNIYRMVVHPNYSSANCSYVQDLSRTDFETNLRGPSASRPVGLPAWDDAEVAAAITAMDAAIAAAYPSTPTIFAEAATCP